MYQWSFFEKCFILEIHTMPFFWAYHVAVASANRAELSSLGGFAHYKQMVVACSIAKV